MTRMVHYRQFRLGNNTGWRGRAGRIIAMTLALALGIALVVLALGLALVLIPIVVVALLIAAWRLRELRAALARATEGTGQKRDREEPRTIQTDYTVTNAAIGNRPDDRSSRCRPHRNGSSLNPKRPRD